MIRRATERDVPVLARTYGRAFADDPVVRWLIPDDADYDAIRDRFFVPLTLRWLHHGTLWCTDDGVAVAGWNPPGRPEVDVVDPDPIEHPEWRIERFLALRAVLGEHTPPEEHWHLNMLATHPDWQRRGLGGALMDAVFRIADEQGLPCYLETETEANVAYYRRHGFEVRSEWDVATDDAEGPHMWGMLRPAGERPEPVTRPWMRIAGTVFSSRRARDLAGFYARLLDWPMRGDEEGWVVVRPDGVSHGLSFHEDVEYVPPVWPSRPDAQQMMVHLDIGTDDLDAAVAWAIECGATVAEHQPQAGVRVVLDPDGHPFCLFPTERF